MKQIRRMAALTVLSALLSAGLAFAQNRHGNSNYVSHPEWKKGAHINKSDWGRGTPVNYRTYHLSAPPRGYQWRQVDGNYVLAAVATGVISSVIVASAGH